MRTILVLIAVFMSRAAVGQTALPTAEECGPLQQRHQELLKINQELLARLERAQDLLKRQQELLKRAEEGAGASRRIQDDMLAPKYHPPLVR